MSIGDELRKSQAADEPSIVTKKRSKSAPAVPLRRRSKSAAIEATEPPASALPDLPAGMLQSLRLPRPDGATIVLEVSDAPEIPEYFERVRAWFDARPEELTLFEEADPYSRSKREIAAFAIESNLPTSTMAPPTKTALRLEVEEGITPSRDDVPAPIVGINYPVVSSVTRRAISNLVLSAASAPGAFTTTDRGLVFIHEETLALGEVMLRPQGESRLATPARRLGPEQIEEIRRSVPAWSPLDEDTLEIMLSHVANNEPDDDGLWTLFVDQILDARALRQKSRADGVAKAGYRADDRTEVMRSIGRLDSAWARVYRPDDPNAIHGDEDFARVVLIAEVRRRSDRLARIRYRPGTWYDPGDATTRSPRKVLEYDPYREAVEKHLARYFLQRIDEADDGGVITRTVQELCGRGGVALDRNNPKRMRERLTKALDRLVMDGAIIRWTYADDPRILPSRGYVDSWLAFRVRVIVQPPT